jgi:hypothetical protein
LRILGRGGQSDNEGMDEQEVKAVNDRFNDELDLFIKGELTGDHVFKLGKPSWILEKTGFPQEHDIDLLAKQLKEKSEVERHRFPMSGVKNLVGYLQEPIAIFDYNKNAGAARNVILDIQKDNKNFLVGVLLKQCYRDVEVSNIRTIFPKQNAEWLNWINEGRLLYANIDKLKSLVAQQRMNLADVGYLDFLSIESLIEEYKNVKHYFTHYFTPNHTLK